MQQKKTENKEHTRIPDGVKVTQSGQIFTINNMEDSDKGKYHCKVQSTVIVIENLIPVTYGSQGNHCVYVTCRYCMCTYVISILPLF